MNTETGKSRGFITIATGKKTYYKLAANLLISYRYTTDFPLPFAIIAEEENEYTALFDEVIIVKEVRRSFLDKLLLLKYCPYYETIFLDSDILAYGDLNEYWRIFEGATDFSSLGENYDLDQPGAWYEIDGIGEYASKLKYKVRVHMGICFIRQSPALGQLYQDCIDILENYDKLTINIAPGSKDEATLGIAMPMNQMKAVKELPEYLAVLPCLTKLKVSILSGKLEYTNRWGTSVKQGGLLIHFGTEQTYEPLYRFESECFYHLSNNTTDTVSFMMRYRLGTRWISLSLDWYWYKIKRFCLKAYNKITRIIKGRR